jgi:hypothetical protein
MQHYFIEGLFITRKGLKKSQKSGKAAQTDVEPFAAAFWANSPADALQMAAQALEGGQWLETPKISTITEEQRMRAIGAPELPGFSTPVKKTKRKP